MQEPQLIKTPSITIEGVRYTARLGFGALYRLEEMGIGTTDLQGTIERGLLSGRNVITTFTILAAILGTTDAAGNWIEIPFTAKQLADKVPMEALADLQELIRSVILKASPARKNDADPALANEQQPQQ